MSEELLNTAVGDDPGGVPFDDDFEAPKAMGMAPALHDSPTSLSQRGIVYPGSTPVGMKRLRDYVIGRWGGSNLGILSLPPRPVRGGSEPSLHNWGMAWDWRWGDPGPGRANADEVIAWCLEHHDALGIQAVHDYVSCRYWKNYAGWKTANNNPSTGFGQSWSKWIHIERTWSHANLDTPIDELLVGSEAGASAGGPIPAVKTNAGATSQEPSSSVSGGSAPTKPAAGWLPRGPLSQGSIGADVARVQDFLRFTGHADFARSDGEFGPRTEVAVKAAQEALVAQGLYTKKIDGVWGPKTSEAAEASAT